MNRTALLACVLPLLVLSAACNRSKADGAPAGQTTLSGAVAAATAPSKAQKLIGSWVATDGSGETLQITADTMTTTYTKVVGGKPLASKYAVMKEEGNVIVVSASVDLGNGKSFAGDPQNLTLLDDDTLDKRNSINKSGNLFKRKK